MLAAVDADPAHPAALTGLESAASALAILGRLESAQRIWRRVVNEGMPMLAPEADAQLVLTVTFALDRLATEAVQRADWAEAAHLWRMLADSPRFRGGQVVGMHEHIGRALVGASDALERRGELLPAARYLLRAVDWDPSDPGSAGRLDHAAELYASAGQWREAVRTSEQLIDRYGRHRPAAEMILRAHDRIVRSLEHRGARADTVREARVRLLAAYEQVGASPGSPSATIAARAALALAAEARLPRVVARGGSERARVRSFQRSLSNAAQALSAADDGYERIFAYRSPESSLAALVAMGDRAHSLADAVARANVPTELREAPARELRCRALRSYDLARQAAAASGRPLPETAARALESGSLESCDP